MQATAPAARALALASRHIDQLIRRLLRSTCDVATLAGIYDIAERVRRANDLLSLIEDDIAEHSAVIAPSAKPRRRRKPSASRLAPQIDQTNNGTHDPMAANRGACLR